MISMHPLSSPETCIDGLIGLVPSSDDVTITLSHYVNGRQRAGRVEACYNHVMGAVCHDEAWSEKDASVVCQQLGFSPYGWALVNIKTLASYYIILHVQEQDYSMKNTPLEL